MSVLDKEEVKADEEQPKVEEAEVEKPKEVEKTPEEPLETETETTEDEPEEKPVSRRESLRIQQVIERAKQGAYGPKPEPKSSSGLNYSTELEADAETLKRLEDDRKAYGKSLYEEGLRRADSLQFRTRLEIDAPRVEAKYPQLDKSSPDFHPSLANALNTMYLSAVGYDEKNDTVQNANVRYADYIESMMELADEIAGQKTAKTQKNIARQAANTGLRPDGSSSKRMNLNQSPEKMTDDELKAVIAQGLGK